MTIEQRRSPSPASSPTKLPPSGPLQPIQKAPSPPSPGVPAPAFPRHRASGTQRSPQRLPGRASAGKSGASPAPFMAPTLPGGGTVVSGSSRRRRDGTALRRLGGPTCLSPRSAGKRKPARWRRRARETGSAEGQKSPHALLSQRRRGWPRPGEGRVGGLLTRSKLPAPPPPAGASAVPAHVGRCDYASRPLGALLGSGQPRGGNLRDPMLGLGGRIH